MGAPEEKREIGLVCGDCCTFQPLGARACARCGASLELRAATASTRVPHIWPAVVEPSAPATIRRAGKRPAFDTSAPEARPASAPEPEAPTQRTAVVVATLEEKQMDAARHYVCRSCSTSVPAGHKFCGRCGTPVPVPVRDVKTNYFGEMQNTAKAKLILIRGEGMEGTSFYLKAEQHIVGREGQLMIPDDPFISPRHANFFYRDGHLVVKDEGSLNGVYIRLRASVPIEPGQAFLAGEQVFRLEAVAPITDDGPAPDGTAFYASPRKPSQFRVCQIFRGGATGLCVQADGNSLTVGRDGTALSFPEDLYMSGEHCRIDLADGGYTLTDLESRNGTYVRIDDERVLQDGDFIFLGRKLLRVEMNTN
ncbi:MAG: FHA domain-containing protein [Myxococcales bacterium]|nr:FHA domain-containing protein [Myxococcales bacterium]